VQARDHLVSVARRWRWMAAAGLLGALLATAIAMSTEPRFESTTRLFIGVSQVGSNAELATGSLTRREVLPSVVQLVRSAAVLSPVVAELGLDRTAGQLATDIDAQVTQDTSLLTVVVSSTDRHEATRIASAVADSTRRVTDRLFATPGGPSVLTLTTVSPASTRQVPSSAHTRRNAELGLLIGALAAGLAVSLLERARPLARSAADLDVAPGVLVTEVRRRRRGRGEAERADLERLTWLLATETAETRELVLVGNAARLGRDLADVPGPASYPVAPTRGGGPGAFPSARDVVLVVHAGRTTRRAVHELSEELATTGSVVRAVVVDGVPALPRGPFGAVLAALRHAWPMSARPVRASAGSPRGAGRISSDQVVAVVALFVIAFDPHLPKGLTLAFVVALLLLPVWVGSLAAYRGARALALLVLLALATGGLLAARSSVDRGFAAHEALSTSLLVLGAVGLVGLIAWSRTMLPLWAIGAVFGLGMLTHAVLSAGGTGNPYKFGYSLPVTIIVLSLLSRRPRPARTVTALVLLGLADIAADARSAFAFCLLAGALVLWQARPVIPGRRASALQTIGLLAFLATGAYFALSELLTSGVLGAGVQARTTAQIDQSGSLLLGGRPEWTATWALMQQHPWGFGLGTVPSATDLATAKAGLAAAHIPTINGYLENYLLNGRFELHSIVADLWTNLGPLGLATGLFLGFLGVRGLAQGLSDRQAAPLLCFLALRSIWVLAFGPLPSNLLEVALTVGLALVLVPPRAAEASRPIGAYRSSPVVDRLPA
jgi:capsular polysaccharide biosynthesis protein